MKTVSILLEPSRPSHVQPPDRVHLMETRVSRSKNAPLTYTRRTGCCTCLSLQSVFYVFSFSWPTSAFCTLSAPRHRPQTSAVWGAQHHRGLRLHGARVAFPRDRRSSQPAHRQHQPWGGGCGQYWFWQDRHHLPPCGAQLPWHAHEADCLWQPSGLTQT